MRIIEYEYRFYNLFILVAIPLCFFLSGNPLLRFLLFFGFVSFLKSIVHELGHVLFARKAGYVLEEVLLGMNKTALSAKVGDCSNSVSIRIGAIPLDAMVIFRIPEHSCNQRSVGPKVLYILGGLIFDLVLLLLVIFAMEGIVESGLFAKATSNWLLLMLFVLPFLPLLAYFKHFGTVAFCISCGLFVYFLWLCFPDDGLDNAIRIILAVFGIETDYKLEAYYSFFVALSVLAIIHNLIPFKKLETDGWKLLNCLANKVGLDQTLAISDCTVRIVFFLQFFVAIFLVSALIL